MACLFKGLGLGNAGKVLSLVFEILRNNVVGLKFTFPTTFTVNENTFIQHVHVYLICIFNSYFLDTLYSSEKFGSDENGDGTESKPFKTALKVRYTDKNIKNFGVGSFMFSTRNIKGKRILFILPIVGAQIIGSILEQMDFYIISAHPQPCLVLVDFTHKTRKINEFAK